MGLKKPFNQPLQDNVKHQAKPESKRSQKRRLALLAKMGDPEALLSQHVGYVERRAKRDKRFSDCVKPEDFTKCYGQFKVESKMSTYQIPDPTWDELIVEASRLMRLHVEKIKQCDTFDRQGVYVKKSTLKPLDVSFFLNSAFHNLTSSGNFIEQTSPSKPKLEILNLKSEPVEKNNSIRLVKVIKKAK